MTPRRRSRFSRAELAAAARVAAVATVALAVLYAGGVALLDGVVSDHLTGQVDRQLAARLAAAVADPRAAFASAGIQTSGARYGLGIYGEPIGLWEFDRAGVLEKTAVGDPVLPATVRPPGPGGATALDGAVGATTYRFEWQRTGAGELLAGESLTELGHVEAVLLLAEGLALPLLLLLVFLAALAIGLRAAHPVEQARRRQLDFTADASHELRTPLSVIEAEISLARGRPRTAEEYEAVLDRVAGETRRLTRIVEDLLRLARADAAFVPDDGEPVDLPTLAEETAARFGALAAGSDQQIEVAHDDTGRALAVDAPADWLDNLAAVLVDNACRYAGQGARIRLTVGSRSGGRRVAFQVEDSGPGIAPSHREAVTGRFRRASDAPGGHGLGLAIARAVAEATGGRLELSTSDLGGLSAEVSWPASRRAAGPGR